LNPQKSAETITLINGHDARRLLWPLVGILNSMSVTRCRSMTFQDYPAEPRKPFCRSEKSPAAAAGERRLRDHRPDEE
jgi:hypothetical protein